MSIDNGINGSEVSDTEVDVEQNADALDQDDTLAFDEDSTGDEEYTDIDDEDVGELNFDVDGDRMNEVTPENEANY